MTPELTPKTAPSPTFTLSSGRVLFMSYGLILGLEQLFPEVQEIGTILLNQQSRTIILNHLLTEYDEEGKVINPAKLLDYNPTECIAVARWGVEHLLYFIITQLREAVEVSAKSQPAILSQIQQIVEVASKPQKDG